MSAGWVCGKGMKNLQFLETISGVMRMRVKDREKNEEGSLDVFGSPNAVDDARLVPGRGIVLTEPQLNLELNV